MQFSSDLERQLNGYGLTTAHILYRIPDFESVLQTYVWQDYDLAPDFPEMRKFLDFWRDSLDGPEDKDQGVAPIGNASNIVPADDNGIAFSRTAGEVLNIVYLNSDAVDQGGFFPTGVNGTIMTSDAN